MLGWNRRETGVILDDSPENMARRSHDLKCAIILKMSNRRSKIARFKVTGKISTLSMLFSLVCSKADTATTKRKQATFFSAMDPFTSTAELVCWSYEPEVVPNAHPRNDYTNNAYVMDEARLQRIGAGLKLYQTMSFAIVHFGDNTSGCIKQNCKVDGQVK